MTDSTLGHGIASTPIPIATPGEILPYAIFTAVVGAVLLFFVGAEQGAAAVFSGTSVHEFVHDARHLLAFPCH